MRYLLIAALAAGLIWMEPPSFKVVMQDVPIAGRASPPLSSGEVITAGSEGNKVVAWTGSGVVTCSSGSGPTNIVVSR